MRPVTQRRTARRGCKIAPRRGLVANRVADDRDQATNRVTVNVIPCRTLPVPSQTCRIAPTPLGAPSVLASWARAIVRALEAHGVDGRALAARAGLDAMRLDDANARYPLTATRELWSEAVRATDDPSFGLYVSRFANFATFHALGSAVLASGTLREAFTRLVRYGRIVSDGAAAQLEEHGTRVRLVLALTTHTRPPDEAIDALMALQVRVVRLLLDRADFHPLRVDLERPTPASIEPYQRFFRAPIHFAAAVNALEFRADDVDARLPAGNAEVARRIDDVLTRYLARFDDRDALGRLRAAIIERLPDGQPSQGSMARALGMSARTLQRRLADAGVSYQALLDDARRELARVYLDEGWSITETAFTLGFADCSSFSRAYRRWTGAPPSEHSARARLD